MKECILSIDVGIKNLGLCVLSKDKIIQYWNVINIEPESLHQITCSFCKMNARYYILHQYFCKKHAKNSCSKSTFYFPYKNEKVNKVTRYHMKDIHKYGTEHELSFTTSTRDDMINEIKIHMIQYAFQNFQQPKNKFSLIDYGKQIHIQFSNLINELKDIKINTVLIENQLGNIATNMKSLQAMICQFFIDIGIHDIQFISSSKKLQHIAKNKKITYKDRKSIGILYTKELLINQLDWIDFMESHKKKDDLCDSFLQGYSFLS